MHRFVPTKETCQLLKEAGMPQEEGEFYWRRIQTDCPILTSGIESELAIKAGHGDSYARAPLTDELLKLLKNEYDKRSDILSSLSFVRLVVMCLLSDNIPESLAQLCLELVKEGVGLW